MLPKVSLFITATDLAENFLLANFPYLISNSNYEFWENFLVLDRVENEAILIIAREYRKYGIIKDFFPVDYREYQSITQKYGENNYFNNKKGNFAYLYGIEKCSGDYILHYDIDLLLYSKTDFSWIKEAIYFMEKYQDIFQFHPPPPLSKDINFLGRKSNCLYNKDRNLREYPDFSTRVFLVRNTIKNVRDLSVKGFLEEALTEYMEKNNFYRCEFPDSQNCFILHSHSHWFRKLPLLQKVSKLINRGLIPPEQLNKYDIKENVYIRFLNSLKL